MVRAKKKAHGNTGRRNAAKEVRQDDRLVIRISAPEKAVLTARAEAAGLTLSAWARQVMIGKL